MKIHGEGWGCCCLGTENAADRHRGGQKKAGLNRHPTKNHYFHDPSKNVAKIAKIILKILSTEKDILFLLNKILRLSKRYYVTLYCVKE
jgi:hypothetical protein